MNMLEYVDKLSKIEIMKCKILETEKLADDMSLICMKEGDNNLSDTKSLRDVLFILAGYRGQLILLYEDILNRRT